tara:strand:+ start:109 stop:498 length:390 start_codon:yes stop_codon:yes gene_type:complete
MAIPAAILALIQAGRIAAPLAARTLAGTTATGLEGAKRVVRPIGQVAAYPFKQIARANRWVQSFPQEKQMSVLLPLAVALERGTAADKKRLEGLKEAKEYKHGIWGLHDPERKYYPPRTTRGLKRGFHQ